MTDEKELSASRKALDLLKGDCDIAYKLLCEARNHMLECRTEWDEYRLQYEAADRELAMIDGRYKEVKLTHKGHVKKDVSIILTSEQIQEIADRLGIKIEMPD